MYHRTFYSIFDIARTVNGGSGGGSVIPPTSSDGTMGSSFTTNNTVGGLKSGTLINATDKVKDVLKRQLVSHVPPVVNQSINPTQLVYKLSDTIPTLTLTGVVTRKDADVTNVKCFVNGTAVKTITTSVNNGGTFTHSLTNVNTTTKVKWSATDNTNATTTTSEITIQFANPVIRMAGATATASEDLVVKANKYEWTNINVTADVCVIKFPSAWGSAKSILDANGFTVTGSFNKTTETINGDTYTVYTSATASTLSNFKYVFNF